MGRGLRTIQLGFVNWSNSGVSPGAIRQACQQTINVLVPQNLKITYMQSENKEAGTSSAQDCENKQNLVGHRDRVE